MHRAHAIANQLLEVDDLKDFILYEPSSGHIRRDLETRGFRTYRKEGPLHGWGLYKDVTWKNGTPARIWVHSLILNDDQSEYNLVVQPFRDTPQGAAGEYRDFRDIERKHVLWAVDSIERKMGEQDYDPQHSWYNNVPMPDHYWGDLAL